MLPTYLVGMCSARTMPQLCIICLGPRTGPRPLPVVPLRCGTRSSRLEMLALVYRPTVSASTLWEPPTSPSCWKAVQTCPIRCGKRSVAAPSRTARSISAMLPGRMIPDVCTASGRRDGWGLPRLRPAAAEVAVLRLIELVARQQQTQRTLLGWPRSKKLNR